MGSALVKPPAEGYLDSKTGAPLARQKPANAKKGTGFPNPFARLSRVPPADAPPQEELASVEVAPHQDSAALQNQETSLETSVQAPQPDEGDSSIITYSLVTRLTVVKVSQSLNHHPIQRLSTSATRARRIAD